MELENTFKVKQWSDNFDKRFERITKTEDLNQKWHHVGLFLIRNLSFCDSLEPFTKVISLLHDLKENVDFFYDYTIIN